MDEGLRSEELSAALDVALGGASGRLRALLARHGGLPGPRPALALAAAFGEAAATKGRAATRLLEELAQDDAAPDTAEAFLPIAAAHAYTARWRAGVDARGAEAALVPLAGDERAPVRLGVVNALAQHAAQGHADALVESARGWIHEEDRELRWGALAVALDALAQKPALAQLARRDEALALLTELMADLASAPRAAERSAARRRALAALADGVGAFVAAFREPGIAWLEARCGEAKHPDVRASLALAIDRLRAPGAALRVPAIERLRDALASSAKPPRDPSRIREGTGRGKRGSRRGR